MFGIYSFKVSDPSVFLREVFGTSSLFTVDGITGQLKSKVVSGVADLLAEAAIPALDLSSKYDEIAVMSKKKLDKSFKEFGLSLESLVIENISLPEDVEKVLDKRTSMGIIGDSLNQYTRYQAAESIRDAAQNSSGTAGAGVGLGAGMGIGKIFAEAFSPGQQAQPQTIAATEPTTAAATATAKTKCSSCGVAMSAQAKFCLECGTKVAATTKKCAGCGNELPAESKFCQECGQKQ